MTVGDGGRELFIPKTGGGGGGGGGGIVTFNTMTTTLPVRPRGSRFRLYFSEGEQTLDRRIVDINAINFNRPPPWALRYQRTSPAEGGHAGSEIAGVIEKAMRDGNVIISEGRLDLSPEGGKTAGDEVERLAFAGMLQTWSPDLAAATIDLEENVTDEDANTPQDTVAHFVEATFNGGTVVAQPSLASAVFELLAEDGTVLVPAPSRETINTEAVGDSTDPEEQKMITERTDGPAFAEEVELTAEEVQEELWALSMVTTIDELAAREFPIKARKKMADKGVARPDGSYPVPDKDALKRAVQAIGRAKPEDRAAVKAHIRKRAKALGVPVPEGAKDKKVAASIVACAGPASAPAEWFSDPQLTELQRWVTVTADGRIYGHAAGFGECHIGYMDRCVTIDMIADCRGEGNFEYAMPGHVITADGTKIGTGPITIKGGHAEKGLGWRESLAHYDDPDAAVADVVYGMDQFGVWFSGALRPDANENKVHAVRASGVSLDAREIGGKLRYLATCSVNTEGFPKVSATYISASGVLGDGDELVTLIAAGGKPESAFDHDDTCGCGHTEDVEKELERIRNVISASGMEELALERMGDDILSTLTLD